MPDSPQPWSCVESSRERSDRNSPSDAIFPSLYQIRQRGLALSPISYATAHMAALFVKHFPRDLAGVFPPGAIPLENRQAILKDVQSRGIRITTKVTRKKILEEDEVE